MPAVDPFETVASFPLQRLPTTLTVAQDADGVTADLTIRRGASWLLWRHQGLHGMRIDGPLHPELLPTFERGLADLIGSGDAPPTEVLIDASAFRAGAGPDQLAPIAQLVARMARCFGPPLQRVALVAPSDWSTPWWHGLAILAAGHSVWRTFTSWEDAYSWLGGRLPMHAALESALADTRHPLIVSLENALHRFPPGDLARISRDLGLSKRTLQRVLAREGVAFHTLRTRVRLEQAQTLLADPNTKISAVASAVGFASTGHFIHWFRRHRGLTPGAWRTCRETNGMARQPRHAGDV